MSSETKDVSTKPVKDNKVTKDTKKLLLLHEYAWEVILSVIQFFVALVILVIPKKDLDAGTRVVLSFGFLSAVHTLMLNLHVRKNRWLLQDKLDSIEGAIKSLGEIFPIWFAAQNEIKNSTDEFFVRLANKSLGSEMKMIAKGQVHYVITENPNLIRQSISSVKGGRISALYYAGNLEQIKLWNDRMMTYYLESTSKEVLNGSVDFRRVICLSHGVIRNYDDWAILKSVLEKFVALKIRTYVVLEDKVSSSLETHCDIVLIHGLRAHVHAKKGLSQTTYSTARLIVASEEIERLGVFIEDLQEHSFEYPGDEANILTDLFRVAIPKAGHTIDNSRRLHGKGKKGK